MEALVQVPDERAFVERFVRVFLKDSVDNPPPKIISPQIVLQHSIARLMRVTLKVARDAGVAGVPPSSLRAAFNALDVPTGLRELIERKLTTDGVVRVVGDRMVFCGTATTWKRLAGTPA